MASVITSTTMFVSSVTEIGSSQQGQVPPGPSLRAKLWHSSQYCYLLGALDEHAVVEERASTDESDEVRAR
jgi:hypothetical protein